MTGLFFTFIVRVPSIYYLEISRVQNNFIGIVYDICIGSLDESNKTRAILLRNRPCRYSVPDVKKSPSALLPRSRGVVVDETRQIA